MTDEGQPTHPAHYEHSDRCPCGQPLHYNDPTVRALVDKLVEQRGWAIAVETPAGRWLVPRHYIALHGISAPALPLIAERYGFEATT